MKPKILAIVFLYLFNFVIPKILAIIFLYLFNFVEDPSIRSFIVEVHLAFSCYRFLRKQIVDDSEVCCICACMKENSCISAARTSLQLACGT